MKDRYDIGNDIAKLVLGSKEPLEEIKYIVRTCDTLWDMQIDVEKNKMKRTVRKIGVLKFEKQKI